MKAYVEDVTTPTIFPLLPDAIAMRSLQFDYQMRPVPSGRPRPIRPGRSRTSRVDGCRVVNCSCGGLYPDGSGGKPVGGKITRNLPLFIILFFLGSVTVRDLCSRAQEP